MPRSETCRGPFAQGGGARLGDGDSRLHRKAPVEPEDHRVVADVPEGEPVLDHRHLFVRGADLAQEVERLRTAAKKQVAELARREKALERREREVEEDELPLPDRERAPAARRRLGRGGAAALPVA